MKIFGKSATEYFAFQKAIVILIVVVGLLRLAMSLAGFPVSTVRWISLTAMAGVGIIYCAVQVPRTGFGGYKHLLPLFFIQSLTGNVIITGGIALAAITGRDNIYSVPEYSGPLAGNPWLHAAGHLLDGLILGPLLGWLVGSAIMFVVRRLLPSKAGASGAAGPTAPQERN
jgi:hypothetical protein